MTQQTMRKVEQTAQAVEQTAEVVEETAHVAREELDWATLREAAVLAAMAALRFTQWWLCGRGFHVWEEWEYDDGSVVEQCSPCGAQRDSEESSRTS